MRHISNIGRFALLVSLAAAGSGALAQSYLLRRASPAEERKLIVDYRVFPSEQPDLVRLEVYFQVYNYALQFERVSDSLFRARYVTTVRIIDRERDTVVVSDREEREAAVGGLDQTQSPGDFRTAQFNASLPPGKYEVGFLLESVGSKATLRRDFDIELKAYLGRNPELSDLELVQAAGPIEPGRGGSDFAKGDLVVVPALTNTFSGESDGKLMYYMEIHRGADSLDEVTVVSSLRLETSRMVYRDSLTVALSERITRQLREISLRDFKPGDYELVVSLHGRRHKKLDEEKAEFRVPWTSTAILRHDWDAALDQLELIADRREIKPMRQIDSLTERVKALEAFWAGRDPDPSTAVNEVKIAFYHRVDVANRMFSILNQDGWRTDRGHVLIRYGEPDQIDDYPLVPDSYPYQEWHYYRDGRYRKFVFVDVNEDGDYRLQYPYDGLNQRPDF